MKNGLTWREVSAGLAISDHTLARVAFILALTLFLFATDFFEPPEAEEAVAEMPSAIETVEPEQAGEDPNEDGLITVALVEQGYFREDVPLTFEEQDYLQTACAEFGVEYGLMLSLIYRETRFQNIAGDSGDSIGYCQIQPRCWSGLMEEIGAEDLMEPQDNFRTACAIVAQLTEKYGNVRDALSAYNTGSPGYTEYAASVLSGAENWG